MTTTAKTNDNELTNKIQVVLKHLSEGGVLKDLAQFTDEEVDSVNAVAASYFMAEKFDEAIELYRFLAFYDHTDPRWPYSLGVCQQAAGDYQNALTSYATATMLNVEDPRPQAQAGYCLMALKKLKEAESAFTGCIDTCGDNPGYADIKKQATELLQAVKSQLVNDK